VHSSAQRPGAGWLSAGCGGLASMRKAGPSSVGQQITNSGKLGAKLAMPVPAQQAGGSSPLPLNMHRGNGLRWRAGERRSSEADHPPSASRYSAGCGLISRLRRPTILATPFPRGGNC
jgi:hypothetical protein